jgi:solute carrier family 24 (sodium/potassium/calcium exchanger), member 6
MGKFCFLKIYLHFKIGDAVSDVIVARKGYPSMAIGSIFGSPMLNMLIGLGIAFTFNPITLTKFCYPIDSDPVVSLTFIFLLFALLCSLIVFPIFKFSVGKIYGTMLILLYLVYLILAVIATVHEPFGNIFKWEIGRGCKK